MQDIEESQLTEATPASQTRGQQVSFEIRERILSGVYPGGFHMNEAEISASFGVSRTPVRAALTRLAAEGLLSYTPNTGYVVRSFSRSDVMKIYEVRAVLFGLAAQRAAVVGLGEKLGVDAAEIVAASEKLLGRKTWDAKCSEAWAELGSRFVAVVEQAAENEYLMEVALRSRDIPGLTSIRFRWLNKEVAQRLHLSHTDIFYAIEQRQQIRAESLAREHIFKLAQSAIKEIAE